MNNVLGASLAEGPEKGDEIMERTHINEVQLTGTVLQSPEYSHQNHRDCFYRFPLRIFRLSGQWDELIVLLNEQQMEQSAVREGERLHITGQLRSYNNKSGVGSRLILTVFTQSVCPGGEEDCNLVRLRGALCKPPLCRSTPLGRNICDMMLAVNRRYGRADYIPCIAWGALARDIGEWAVGDTVGFEGRMQSRIYHKNTGDGVQERVAYEVSVMCMMKEE